MKTHLYAYLLIVLSFAGANAQTTWQPTNLTSVSYLAITSMESHKGDLYATVFNGFNSTLYKLDSGNSSWSTVSTGTAITVPSRLRSAGSKLYVSTVNSNVYSMLYYTTNGGSSYVLDTVGLPKSFSGVALIAGLQYYHGKMIANLASYGYYLKDTASASWKSIDVPTALNGGADPVTYTADTLFAYDNTGTHTMYVSGDYGNTWTVRTTNLPAGYATSVFVADDVTGRLYSAGTWSNTSYGVYYSDDHGKNWTLSASANSFISLNANGTQQLVKAIYAHSPYFYMALENNKNNSSPDIVGSSTGFNNLAWDTLGLPQTAASAVYGTGFLMHQGKMVTSLNVMDIYMKGTAIGIHELSEDQTIFHAYPNPCSETLSIVLKNSIKANKIKVLDCTGKILQEYPGNTGSINTSALAEGIYFLEIISEKDGRQIKKFIKN